MKITEMRLTSGGSADSHVIGYRADIDGLRAIAVIAVVLFHLFRSGLPGGFLGVDMFFVLSGYLITAIVWREIQEGRFSIVQFYDRRIRRIMPALLLLLIATTVVAVLLLLPADLIGYCKSLLATLVFMANVYFWRDTDYFSHAAEQKPLLHIWSLGVEEQFYIVFPLLLMLLARWRPRSALYVSSLLTIVSLIANAIAIFVGGALPAFYLLPTRAWELGLGSVLALLPPNTAPRGLAADLLATLGALLVAIGIFHPLSSSSMVPIAFPAVIGSALLVFAGKDHCPLVNRLLRLRPIVFVGLISYSLYLWHWPIIVLGQYYLVRPFTLPEMIAALAVMTACAIASWHFIERPFRSKEMPIQKVRLIAALGVAGLALASAAVLRANGLPSRLSTEAATINQAVDTNYRCPISAYLVFGQQRACAMNLPSRNPMDADVLLLGNSHAQMYAPVWTSILTARGLTGLLIPVNACLPTTLANINLGCIEVARRNLAELSRLVRARIVIVGLNWSLENEDLVDAGGRVLDNSNDRALVTALDDLIDRLQAAGKQVIVIGPIAEPGWDVASTLSRQLAFHRRIDRPTYLPDADFISRFGPAILHFESRGDIVFARPDEVQCHADRCQYIVDGRSLFSDSNHIAVAELERFHAVFEAALASQVKRRP